MKPVETTWPNGKRVAVAIAVLFEVWSEGKAPSYSVQATSLKPGTVNHSGIAWASYGGREGVFRTLRTLDRHSVPATFVTNAHCVEAYPEATKAIVESGHALAGHAYTQDGLQTYMEPDEERATIRKSLDLLNSVSRKPVTGWLSPVLAYTPATQDLLIEAGMKWHSDVVYADRPLLVKGKAGEIVGIPTSDFTDNRVLKSSPRDYYDVYQGTFDFLYRNEPGSLLVLALHCQFGGRPMIQAAFDEVLTYLKSHDDVWFASHDELADWTIQSQRA
jgi:allantoinase